MMVLLLALGLGLDAPVHAAIERAVRERMGDVRVVVLEMPNSEVRRPSSDLPNSEVRSPDSGPTSEFRSPNSGPTSEFRPPNSGLSALPEPGARLGRPLRFVLVDGGRRVGAVVVRLEVTATAVRAARAIARGEAVPADAVDVVNVTLSGLPLRRLPGVDDVRLAHARRDIAGGEILTEAVLVVPPPVRSGDEVTVLLKTGAVAVTSVGRASGSGYVGDRVRVLMASRRTPLAARVTGRGSVEIVQ